MFELTVKKFIAHSIDVDFFTIQLYDIAKAEIVFKGTGREAAASIYGNCYVGSFDFGEDFDIELNIY